MIALYFSNQANIGFWGVLFQMLSILLRNEFYIKIKLKTPLLKN
ncbi:hypothetical protein HPHPH28_1194 [Helicobacter pylori Hp H-28]|nr:hypothetical protein HPHPH28_1194 [Helicobacter pylori Hp H-28]